MRVSKTIIELPKILTTTLFADAECLMHWGSLRPRLRLRDQGRHPPADTGDLSLRVRPQYPQDLNPFNRSSRRCPVSMREILFTSQRAGQLPLIHAGVRSQRDHGLGKQISGGIVHAAVIRRHRRNSFESFRFSKGPMACWDAPPGVKGMGDFTLDRWSRAGDPGRRPVSAKRASTTQRLTTVTTIISDRSTD